MNLTFMTYQMEYKDIILAANILFNNRLNKTGLKSLPKKLIPIDIIDSYKIQNELKILYLTLKDNYCIGKKVGCSNLIAMKQLGVFEPFYGNLFSKFFKLSGCKLKSKEFFKPFMEPEISLIIKNDININDAPFTINDAENLFEGMLPSIEIVDFRFGSDIKKVGINNLIITNGASEYWIKSEKIYPLSSIDLNNHEINLYINNKLIEKGNTNAVLDNPINSGIWIINKLAALGEPMLKGQFISTGTCTKAVPFQSNTNVIADFGLLGKVEIEYN